MKHFNSKNIEVFSLINNIVFALDNLYTDRDTFMIKLDIQGFECKVKVFPIVMDRFNAIFRLELGEGT